MKKSRKRWILKLVLQQTVAGAPLVTVAKPRPQNSSELPGINLDRVSFFDAIGIITQS